MCAKLVIKLMKKQILHILVVTSMSFIIGACDFLKEEELEETKEVSYTNTLEQNLGSNQGCLLYTSPSPRDATLSRMPSSA